MTRHHAEVDRALTEARTDCFARLALGRRGKVLGATIVGPRAGETLAEVTLAVRHGLTATDLASSIHPYPTYDDGVWSAAIAAVKGRLARSSVRRTTGALVALHRSLGSRLTGAVR